MSGSRRAFLRATLAGAAAAALPAIVRSNVAGRDRLNVLFLASDDINNACDGGPAFTQVRRPGFMGRSVRTERWRYIERGGRGVGAQIYEHEGDPGEMWNLVSAPAYSGAIADLRRLLHRPIPL